MDTVTTCYTIVMLDDSYLMTYLTYVGRLIYIIKQGLHRQLHKATYQFFLIYFFAVYSAGSLVGGLTGGPSPLVTQAIYF